MSNDWDEHEHGEKTGHTSSAKPAERAQEVHLDTSLIRVLGRRPADNKLVTALAQSIVDQGLKHPIHVFKLTGMLEGKYGLATGANRLAAYGLLGRPTIPARIISRREARAWGPSENLHRRNLKVLERSESIVKYASARKGLRGKKRGGEQPNDRSVSQLHRDLGFSRKLIAEALLHESIPEDVKCRIWGTEIEDNRSLLTKIAKAKSAAEQVRLVDAVIGKARQAINRGHRKVESDRSNNPSGLCGVDELLAVWAKSKVRKLFDDQSPEVQRAFVRRIGS